ncbi:MAG: AAA family ATPase [Actinomycetota bacterium]|nr:AAA family ATPase [Actinomycetota bacterium]
MSDHPPVVPAEECFDPATAVRRMSNGRGRLRISAVDDYVVGDEVQGQVHELPTERRIVPAGTAIFGDDAQQTALWGHNSSPLWATGESLFIVGPIGVGKTTLGQRLVLGRLGVTVPELLGLPVVVDPRPWLYIAADRPRQALRSMRRMVTEDQREILDERLLIWKGPLPFTLTKEPWRLATWLQELGCAGAFIDSLKDVAVGLSSDEVGGQVNLALQEVTAAGLELVVNHHQRKGTAENRRPKALEDVYGSTWLVAGAGSVVILWGAAGDPILELHHLKQPAEPVGPLTVGINHVDGLAEVYEGQPDLFQAVAGAGRGMSATGAAMVLFRTTEPDRNQIERARRRLTRLHAEGLVHRRGGGKDDAGRQAEALYFAVASVPEGVEP